MKTRFLMVPAFLVAAILFGTCGSNAWGGVIYVADGDSARMHAYDLSTGAQLLNKRTLGNIQSRLTRFGIWLGHRRDRSNIAREYDTNGDATGNSANLSSFNASQLLDGTTDGTANYAINWNTGQVMRANLDWSGMSATPIFTSPFNDLTGITYDSNGNSIWLANSTTAYEYSLHGHAAFNLQSQLRPRWTRLRLDE